MNKIEHCIDMYLKIIG